MSETRERHNFSQATKDSRMGSRHDDTITTLVDYDEVDIVLKDVENTWGLDELLYNDDSKLIYDVFCDILTSTSSYKKTICR